MSEETDAKRYCGKYRGTVTINVDPLNLGRIQATVPDVFGEFPSGWALPSMPFAGPLLGFYAVPPVGSYVWIEFEGGDPEHPIWTGCFWGLPAEVPPPANVPAPPPATKVLLRTQQGHSILLDDTPGAGGITLTAAPGVPGAPTVSVTQLGIVISFAPGGPTIALSPSGIQMVSGGQGIQMAAGASTLQLSPATGTAITGVPFTINGVIPILP